MLCFGSALVYAGISGREKRDLLEHPSWSTLSPGFNLFRASQRSSASSTEESPFSAALRATAPTEEPPPLKSA